MHDKLLEVTGISFEDWKYLVRRHDALRHIFELVRVPSEIRKVVCPHRDALLYYVEPVEILLEKSVVELEDNCYILWVGQCDVCFRYYVAGLPESVDDKTAKYILDKLTESKFLKLCKKGQVPNFHGLLGIKL